MTKRRDAQLVKAIDDAEALLRNVDLGGYDIDWLRQLVSAHELLNEAIRVGVQKARSEGSTWAQVAVVLHLNSRQAAEAKYRG